MCSIYFYKLANVLADILLKIFPAKFNLAGKETVLQSIKFGIIGISNTVISYVLYIMILWLLQYIDLFSSWDYLFSQAVSFLLSVYWSFYWNNKLVFTLSSGEYRSWWRSLIKTYISYSFTGLFLNWILLYVWIELIDVSEYVAPLINLIVTVPLNFIINKYWAFKSKYTTLHDLSSIR